MNDRTLASARVAHAPLVMKRAGLADCATLAETSKRAFDADTAYGAPEPGGPPGYDSPRWFQAMLRQGQVFRLVMDNKTIGGVITFAKGRRWRQLGRIWLVPEAQGRGLGRQTIAQIEAMSPEISRWTLDTPIWNWRTRAFYAALGYNETGQDDEFVYFEKCIT